MGDMAFGAAVVAVVLTGAVVGWTLAAPAQPQSDFPRVHAQFQLVDPKAKPVPPPEDEGSGAADREKVRQAVIHSANGLVMQPCDEASRQQFLDSVRTYFSHMGPDQRRAPAGTASPLWTTRSDRVVIGLITDLSEKGYVQPEEMSRAFFGSTMQGQIVVLISEMTGKRLSGQADGPTTPACRRATGGSDDGGPATRGFYSVPRAPSSGLPATQRGGL